MRKKHLFRFLALCAAATVSVALGTAQSRHSKNAIFQRVQEHHRAYAEIAEQALIFGTLPKKLPRGVKSVRPWRGVQVDFLCRRRGLGSAGRYQGFYYSADNVIRAFQGAEAPFSPHGAGYLWRQPGGNNRCYVERIENHWYYFEMRS